MLENMRRGYLKTLEKTILDYIPCPQSAGAAIITKELPQAAFLFTNTSTCFSFKTYSLHSAHEKILLYASLPRLLTPKNLGYGYFQNTVLYAKTQTSYAFFQAYAIEKNNLILKELETKKRYNHHIPGLCTQRTFTTQAQHPLIGKIILRKWRETPLKAL